jgi:hypothetical protein
MRVPPEPDESSVVLESWITTTASQGCWFRQRKDRNRDPFHHDGDTWDENYVPACGAPYIRPPVETSLLLGPGFVVCAKCLAAFVAKELEG